MATEKRININFSSLIDLKAELFKKQEALKAEKLRREFGQPSSEPPKKKSQVKQNAGVQERAKKDVVEETVSQEEIDLLQQSRAVLEKKAKIYESLTDGNMPDDEVKDFYLVDFQRKVLNRKKLDQSKGNDETKSSFKENLGMSEEENFNIDFDDIISNSSEKDEIPPPSDPDEEWVDYTDTLGRSRRCLKKDLPALLEMDKHLKKNNKNTTEEIEDVDQDTSENLSSELPEPIEIPAEPVHYQTVQHNEIRTHGVGYFSFSTEEEERKAQMESLNQMREQTEKQRSARERLKEKRRAILKARLNKVKKRKNIEVEESDESASDEEFDPLKQPVPEKETEEDKPEKSPKIRPWDVGKISNQGKKYKYTQESWVEERRSERVQEFAPPTTYNKKARDYNTKPSQEKPSPQVSNDEKSELSEESEDDTINDNDSIPSPQNSSDNEIQRMIAETVTYYRKQAE